MLPEVTVDDGKDGKDEKLNVVEAFANRHRGAWLPTAPLQTHQRDAMALREEHLCAREPRNVQARVWAHDVAVDLHS